jgi:hypothetical protein
MMPRPARSLAVAAGAILAALTAAPTPARATVTDTPDSYVCMVGLQPQGVDSKATYTGSHWSATTLYSEKALGALYRGLQRAARSGKSVRLIGTNERPHFQLQSITIYGQ